MNKKAVGKYLTGMVLASVIVVGSMQTTNPQLLAKSRKDTIKVQVLKAVNGTKSGGYTYYLDNTTLKRAKKNGKAKVIAKKVNQFQLAGKYVYYNKETKLYRIRKNGRGKSKQIAKHCSSILEIKGNRIIYGGAYGKFTVKTDGKGNKKIFSYTQDFKRLGERLYYSKDICDEKGNTRGLELRSKKMDGTDDTMEKRVISSQALFYIANNKVHVFCRDSKEATRIFIYTKESHGSWSAVENKCLYAFDNAGVVDDKLFFFHSGLSNAGEELGLKISTKLFQVNEDGSQTEYLDLEPDKVICLFNLGDFYATTKYLVMEDYGDDSGHIYYIFDKNTKKLLKKIDIGKYYYGDEEPMKIKIMGSKVYVLRGGNGGKMGYHIYKIHE